MKSKALFCMALALLCLGTLVAPVRAAEVGCDETYCFSAQDFASEELAGICITGLPDAAAGTVMLGNRVLQPGDILCFYSSGDYIGHSGIYIGNGQFIHSSTYSTGVIISDLDTDAYEARRLT